MATFNAAGHKPNTLKSSYLSLHKTLKNPLNFTL